MSEKHPLLNTAPEFTKEILTHHYNRDSEFVYAALDENIMWIGPLEHQFVFGRDQVRDVLAVEQDIVCTILDMEFYLVFAEGNFCVVAGWIEVCTHEGDKLLLKCRHRLTFTYKVETERLVVTHMHVSESWDVLEENEMFPFRAGRQTYYYMQRMILQKTGDAEKLMVYDTKRRAHFLMEDEIIYAEACNIHCQLHCLDRKILIADGIQDFMNKMPKQFVRVHRSYAVNVNYVTGMERFYIQLCGKMKIPVPEKKYVMIREEIRQRVILQDPCKLCGKAVK